jgi:serine/threonine protein phosphatase 1
MHITEQTFEIGFACDPQDELILFGDIHGHAELLDALLDQAAKIRRTANRRRKLIFNGDLIDRGPESLRSLDLAIGASARLMAMVIGLMGNHEQFLCIGLEEIDEISDLAISGWLRNGGGAVVQEMMKINPGRDLDVPAALGEARLNWLRGLQSHHRSGQILAIHAGLNPAMSLSEALSQPWLMNMRSLREKNHWAWVREPFLDHVPAAGAGHHGYFVVHGHTIPRDDAISTAEQIKRARINIDGGTYKTGRARMVHIVGSEATLFEVSA